MLGFNVLCVLFISLVELGFVSHQGASWQIIKVYI